MKRFISILMCLCLALTVVPVLAAGVSDVMCVTNCKEWVSLREQPDTTSKRLEKVHLGELVTDCTASSDDFVRCEFNGKVGYIPHKYLKMTDYSSGESFPGNQMVVNVEEWTSMWDQPSTSGKRVVKVPVGSIVTSCVGTTGSFILCEYTSGKKVYKGYISTSYLKKANYSASTQNQNVKPIDDTDIDGISMVVVNCNDWVSLREKASASSARLAKVPLGTQVDNCVQVSEGFVYCSYRGVYGYIQAQYLSEPEGSEPPETDPEPDPESDINPNAEPTGFNALPVLPDREAFMQTGENVFSETYQGYTIVVQRVYGEFEEMLAVCYDLNDQPLWRLYAQSLNPMSDVQQLDAFVGGTLEDPQLIWYISGVGIYSYKYGPTVQLRWFLPDSEGLDITDSIIHTADYDGRFYVAFSDVLMLISPEGKLVWRASCDDPSIFWPVSIEIDEDGISVLYDNLFGVNSMYTEARFGFDGILLYKTQRVINKEA